MKNEEQTKRSNNANVALGIIGTSFIGIIALTSPFIIMQLRSPLPYMATPRRKVLEALNEIASRKGTNTNQPLRYYDLGSGDGEAVLAAASAGWRATGIELNSTLWGISSFRRLISHHLIRRKANFVWGDMWKEKINDADAVMIFGVKPLMPQIAKKIETECRPGTFVMSYRFHIPIYGICDDSMGGLSSQSVKDEGALGADLVYDEEEMRIYLLRDDKQDTR